MMIQYSKTIRTEPNRLLDNSPCSTAYSDREHHRRLTSRTVDIGATTKEGGEITTRCRWSAIRGVKSTRRQCQSVQFPDWQLHAYESNGREWHPSAKKNESTTME